MSDKTLQERLRYEAEKAHNTGFAVVDKDDAIAAADALDAQAERIKALEDALDMATQGKYSELMLRLADQCSAVRAMKLDATRIKALEGALRDTAMMLEHAITGRNGERYGFIETRSGSMMHAQGVVEKLRALLGEK